MDTFFHPWSEGMSSHLLLQVVAAGGVSRGIVFLLVASRLAGFFCIGPLLGRTLVSWPVRLGLVVLLTLIVAPSLPLDEGPIASPMMLISHQDRVADSFASSSQSDDWTPASLVVLILSEAGIGAALGLAVATFLSGLKLGGEWLERHSGLGMGNVLNPEYFSGGSAPAELGFLFCVVVMLVMQPVNGHLTVIRFVLDTFREIPVGRVPEMWSSQTSTLGVFELPRAILQQALILGLRIAMPFVLAMSLLDMTLAWIRRSSRWELAPVAYAFRAGAGLLILAATFPGIQEAVSLSLNETFAIAAGADFQQGNQPHDGK